MEADRRIADERYEKQQEERQASASWEKDSHTVSDVDFKYIEPTDYEKIVAELDEEVREALEILVTSCSVYTPFHPFLQDLVNTEDLLMPNKLDFLTEIVLRGESESQKAYAYNSSHLVEYTIKSSSVNLRYYSRSGEEKDVEIGIRILYVQCFFDSMQILHQKCDSGSLQLVCIDQEKNTSECIMGRDTIF